MVRAAPSNEVPCNISANVPISSSATIASPIPPPTTAKPVLDIFLPNPANLKALPAFLASNAFLAKPLAISFCLLNNLFATWVPYLAPLIAPTIPTGAIWAKAWVTLPIVLASAYSSKGFKSSKNFSTEAAVLVSKPRSTNSAPRDTKPVGIL